MRDRIRETLLTHVRGVVAISLVFAASEVRAQTPPPAPPQQSTNPKNQPTPPRVEEHVIVTGRDARSNDPSVQRVEVPAIRDTAGGFENVFQVLPYLPGVAATNDEDGKLSVRGAGPESNLVMIDGVAIHHYQRLGDFQNSFVNPATLRTLTLDASGLDSAYGGRLSSTVIMETRDGNIDRRFAASGSIAFTSGDVLLEGRVPGTRTGSWWASARGTYYRLVTDNDDGGTMPGFGDVQFKLAFHPTPRTRLTLFGLRGREGMKDWLGGYETPEGPVAAAGLLSEFKSTTQLLSSRLTSTSGERVSSTSTLSVYRYDSRDQDYLAPPGQIPFRRRLGMTDLAGRQEFAVMLRRGASLHAGMEGHRTKSSWNMVSQRTFEAGWPTPGPSTMGQWLDEFLASASSRIERTQLGAWLQPRLLLGHGIALDPGVRVEWNSMTAQTELQPRIKLTGHVAAATVWTGFSTQSQTPGHEAMEQGWAYYDLSGPDAGRLRNERVRQFVAGLERRLGGGISVRAEGYYRRFDRLLVQRAETEEERQRRLAPFEIPLDMPVASELLQHRLTPFPESRGRGRAAGLDLLVRRDGTRWRASIAYSRSHSERDLRGVTAPFDYDRPHAVSLAGAWNPTRRITLSAASRFASGFPITMPLPEVVFGRRLSPDGSVVHRPLRRADGSLILISNGRLRLSELNADRLPYYGRTDVRATYSTLGRWEFYGEIINAFDRKNFSVPIVEGDFRGRTDVYLSHERVPSFGLRVRF